MNLQFILGVVRAEKLKETCPFLHSSWKLALHPEPHSFSNSFKDARIKVSSVLVSYLESYIVESEETETFVSMQLWS